MFLQQWRGKALLALPPPHSSFRSSVLKHFFTKSNIATNLLKNSTLTTKVSKSYFSLVVRLLPPPPLLMVRLLVEELFSAASLTHTIRNQNEKHLAQNTMVFPRRHTSRCSLDAIYTQIWQLLNALQFHSFFIAQQCIVFMFIQGILMQKERMVYYEQHI